MRFSFFGVPFVFELGLFTRGRLIQTAILVWAQSWRGFVVGAIYIFLFYLSLEDSIISDEIEFGEVDFLGGSAIRVLFLFFALLYLTYYTLFVKEYVSFKRVFDKIPPSGFFAKDFWKPLLLTMLLGVVVEVLLSIVLWMFHPAIATLINLGVGFVLTHCYLHGGTWGFCFVDKER